MVLLLEKDVRQLLDMVGEARRLQEELGVSLLSAWVEGGVFLDTYDADAALREAAIP